MNHPGIRQFTPEALKNLAPKPSGLVSLSPNCPHCGCALDGAVLAYFRHGELVAFTQTKIVGSNEYTWTHSAAGCYVPSLLRLPPVRELEALRAKVEGL